MPRKTERFTAIEVKESRVAYAALKRAMLDVEAGRTPKQRDLMLCRVVLEDALMAYDCGVIGRGHIKLG